MAGTTIGPLTAKIVADAQGVAAGMAKANEFVSGGTAKLAAAAKKSGEAVGKSFASGVTAVMTGVLGADLLKGAGSKVFDAFTGGTARILDMGKAARGLGVDFESFQAITGAAGSLEMASVAMDKFNDSLTAAAFAGVGADNVFTRLQLNAMDLANKNGVQKWGAVADAIGKLQHPLLQLDAAAGIFGNKLADDILPTLLKGSAELERQGNLLGKYGALFGAGDYAAAQAAARAWQEVGYLWTGVQNQFAVAINPIIRELGERMPSLAEMGVTAAGLGNKIIAGAEWVATAGAWMIDAVGDWRGAWDDVKTWWASAMGALTDAITKGFELGVKGVMAVDWKGILTAGTPAPWMETIKRAPAALRPGEWEMALDDAWLEHLIGMEGRGKAKRWVDELFQDIKAKNADAAQAVRKNGPIAMMMEQARRLQEQLKGPGGLFRDEMSKLQAMAAQQAAAVREIGARGNLLGDVAARGAWKAFEQLKSGVGGLEVKNPQVMKAGSADAFSSINYARQMGAAGGVPDQLRAILEQLKRQEEAEVRGGRDVLDAVKKIDNKLLGRGI